MLQQNYPALQYIIVDGGSSDGSAEIIAKYASRLHWWCSEADAGQADAIRKGLAQSTGEVLCWLNSDDVMLPGALAAVGDYFRQHPLVEVVNGAAYCIDEHDVPMRDLYKCYYTLGVRATARRFQFYGQDGVYQPATFWRRGPYLAVGGIRKEFVFAMDLDLFTRLAKRRRFEVISPYVACFRVHAISKSGTIQETRRAEVGVLQRENGVSDAHPLRRLGWYGWYRLCSLFRKFGLQTKLWIGHEQFPSVPDIDDGSEVTANAQD